MDSESYGNEDYTIPHLGRLSYLHPGKSSDFSGSPGLCVDREGPVWGIRPVDADEEAENAQRRGVAAGFAKGCARL